MHVCPLQIDIVERLINRYSNPGDLWLTPLPDFSPFRMSGQDGPRGKGVELNPDYFRDGVGYLEAADAQQNARPSLTCWKAWKEPDHERKNVNRAGRQNP